MRKMYPPNSLFYRRIVYRMSLILSVTAVASALDEVLTYPQPAPVKKGKPTADMPKHLTSEQYLDKKKRKKEKKRKRKK